MAVTLVRAFESGWLGASLESSPIKRGAADVARRHTGGLAHVLGHLGVPGQSDPCHPVFREWQCRDVSKTRPLLNIDNAEMLALIRDNSDKVVPFISRNRQAPVVTWQEYFPSPPCLC